MTDPIHTRARAAKQQFAINKPLFVSPDPAGRKITAGFSYMQRISKAAAIDVWFPQILREELDQLMAEGRKLGPEHFPAEWAAVRQFDLLQEAGNYKIYDLDPNYVTRTFMDLSKSMRAGGYRVTVATIGSYTDTGGSDDLAILDRRLQDRISRMTHMMYLDEESEKINEAMDKNLSEDRWSFQTALPHVGMVLGSRDLFQPITDGSRYEEPHIIPPAPHKITIADWLGDIKVIDALCGRKFRRVKALPQAGQYAVAAGIYCFSKEDVGREIDIHFTRKATGAQWEAEKKHRLSRQFFDILNLLPQKHIVHDTAVGLQLPESNSENEWIYITDSDTTLSAFNSLLNDIFEPFGKPTAQHLRGYGDHMNASRAGFYRDAAASLAAGPN